MRCSVSAAVGAAAAAVLLLLNKGLPAQLKHGCLLQVACTPTQTKKIQFIFFFRKKCNNRHATHAKLENRPHKLRTSFSFKTKKKKKRKSEPQIPWQRDFAFRRGRLNGARGLALAARINVLVLSGKRQEFRQTHLATSGPRDRYGGRHSRTANCTSTAATAATGVATAATARTGAIASAAAAGLLTEYGTIPVPGANKQTS